MGGYLRTPTTFEEREMRISFESSEVITRENIHQRELLQTREVYSPTIVIYYKAFNT